MDRRAAFKSWCATLYQSWCSLTYQLPIYETVTLCPPQISLHVASHMRPKGMNQARALGELWYTTLRTPIHKIYASDLKRANTTAVQLTAPRRVLPAGDPLACPALHTTPLIREQHFGIAEGKPWSDGPPKATGRAANTRDEQEAEVYETIRTRCDRFPGGESLDDLARRADEAVDALLWPHLDDARAYHARNVDGEEEGGREVGEGGLGYHVVFVSHGLCISEMVAAILRRGADPGAGVGIRLRGLVNTGWTRLQIRPLVSRPWSLSRCSNLSDGSSTGKWYVGYFHRSRQSSPSSCFCCE